MIVIAAPCPPTEILRFALDDKHVAQSAAKGLPMLARS